MVEAGSSSQNPPERWWTREVARGRVWVERIRTLVYRVLDTVPPVRRSVDELVRIEVIDRSMAIGAQALLALVPLVLVLAAFLPHAVTGVGLERIEDVTGIGDVGHQITKGVMGTDRRRDARCRPDPHRHGVRRAADHAALGDQLRAGRATALRAGLGQAAPRRGVRAAAVARLVVRVGPGAAGGRARRVPLEPRGPGRPPSRVLGAPGGARRRRLVVVHAAAAGRAGALGAAGLPGVPDRGHGVGLHGRVGPGDGGVRPRGGPAVRHPGRGPGRGDVAGRVRGRDGRLRRAGPRGLRGPDDPPAAPTTGPGPPRAWRSSGGPAPPPRS